VTLPNGFGSWCYSLGFQNDVTFPDARDYAGDGAQTRTYTPAAIEPDSDALACIQDGTLDARTIKLTLDPALDPFANYCDGRWPLRFGLVIYKVHRNGDAVRTVTNNNVTIPVSQIRFVGHLKTLTASVSDKQQLVAEFEDLRSIFTRRGPVPTISLFCGKKLFSTGAAALACNANKADVRVDGVVAAQSNDLIRATAWASKAAGWFANGLVEYDAMDPISGLTFTFALDVISSAVVVSNNISYGQLTVSPTPPLSMLGVTARAYGGCDRSRATCISKFNNLPNFGGCPDIPIENPALESYR
jgi:hypothetical protein